MIIDYRAGRKTPEGFHHTIKQQYAEAFERAGIASHISGSSFINSSDDKVGGIGLIRDALKRHPVTGIPRLRFIRHACKETVRQISRYRKKVVANADPEDTPADRQKDDLVDDVRYLVSYDPEYVEPQSHPTLGSDAYRFFQRMQSTHGQRPNSGGQSVIMGMP